MQFSRCQYQQNIEVFYTFTPNESYVYLLNVESSNLVFLKTYSTKCDDIIITFTDQNGRLLEIETKLICHYLLINGNDTLLYRT